MDIGFEGWLASSGMGVSGYANQQDTYTLQNGNYNCVIELKKVGDAQSVICVLSSVNGILTDVGLTTANLYLLLYKMQTILTSMSMEVRKVVLLHFQTLS